MNIKGILRSTALKLIVFACIVGCFAGALAIGEQPIVQVVDQSADSTLTYRFESRFEDSYLLNEPAREMTAYLDYALKKKMTQAAFDRYIGDRFPGDYYAKMGDTVLKNADLTEEDALNAAYYVVARPNETQTNMLLWHGDVFDGSVYTVEAYDSQFSRTVKGDYPTNTVMLLRITEEQAAPLRAEWQAQRDSIYGVLNRVVVLTVTGLLLFVLLLFVTGRRGGDEDVHLVTIDRLPVEINVVLFWGVLLLTGGLNIALMMEIVDGASDMRFLLMPSIVFCAAAFALAMELALSLVRVIKNRSFVKQSWCLRFIRWCWGLFVRCVRWCWKTLVGIWHGLGRARRAAANALLRNYKTRNVLLIFFGYSVILAFLAFVFGGMQSWTMFLLGIIWFCAAGYFLLRRINGFDRIVDALRRLRGGDLSCKLTDMPAGVFAQMAEDINSLGDGMQTALQNEVRAERMKSELITNVSHDLKTPLTSILSYSDLLCKEHLTPEEANDYAKIIYQKGLRLKNLTSDLFDISKVQSGAEQIQNEKLDACTLVRQALAEQEQTVANSGVTLKVSIPDGELPIWADGRKMSRVLENLIGNCAKYALKGTRVFVSVAREDGKAVIELKNTANYEMDFAPDEITERFVRGDAARSTEGSGLGLAIAKSYTEACGGAFEVAVDGDLFKVRITFAEYGLSATGGQ